MPRREPAPQQARLWAAQACQAVDFSENRVRRRLEGGAAPVKLVIAVNRSRFYAARLHGRSEGETYKTGNIFSKELDSPMSVSFWQRGGLAPQAFEFCFRNLTMSRRQDRRTYRNDIAPDD